MCKAHYCLIMFQLQPPRRLALMCDVLEEGAIQESSRDILSKRGFFFLSLFLYIEEAEKKNSECQQTMVFCASAQYSALHQTRSGLSWAYYSTH